MKSATCRRGVTLIEVSVAIALMAVLAGMVLEAQVLRGRLHRATRWRESALVEAGNVMQQVTARPWNELEPETLAAFTLSDDFRDAVPNAALQLSVEPSAGPPESRRVSVEIAWPGPTGGVVRPVRLTSWVYRIEPAGNPESPAEAAPAAESKPAAKTEKEPDAEKKPDAAEKPAAEQTPGAGAKPAAEPAGEPKADEQP